MADTVEIIIKTIDESTASTKKVEGGLKDVLSTVGKVTAGVVALGAAAKKAFDLGKEGANLRVLAQSTKNLGVDVSGLQDAVGGTISKFGIMNAQATLLAGTQGDLKQALIDNSEELLRIAKAANAVNPALGTTEFLYESLGRGIKRASPLILDNLGLTIKIGEANAAYAATLGKTAEELTAEEQKMALLNETLRAGSVLLEQAEDVNTEGADSYAKLAAAIKDSTDRGKGLLSEFLEPVIKLMADNADATNDYQENLDYVREAIERGIIPQKFFNRLLEEGHDRGLELADSMAEAAEAVRGIEETRGTLNSYTMDLEKLAQAGREGVDPFTELEEEIQDVAEEAQSAEDALKDLYDAADKDWAGALSGLGNTSVWVGEGGQAFKDFEDAGKGVEDMLLGLSEGANKQFGPVLEDIGNESAKAFIKWQQSLGEISTKDAADQLMDLGMKSGEAWALAREDGDEWRRMLDLQKLRLGEIIDNINRLNGMYAEATVQINVIGGGGGSNFNGSAVIGLPTWTSASGVEVGAQAEGGPLKDIALVGERGPEMVINGVVVPNPLTKALMRLGLVPGKQLATGGTLYDGPLMDGIYTPETAPTGTRPGGRGDTEPGGASGSNNRPAGRQDTKPGGAATSGTSRPSRDGAPDGGGSSTPPINSAYVIASFQNSVETLTQNFTEAVKASQKEQTERLDQVIGILKSQPTQDSQDAGFKSVMQEVNGQ